MTSAPANWLRTPLPNRSRFIFSTSSALSSTRPYARSTRLPEKYSSAAPLSRLMFSLCSANVTRLRLAILAATKADRGVSRTMSVATAQLSVYMHTSVTSSVTAPADSCNTP